jgi:UDP-N-acetylmuramate--alanine ligase
MDLSQIKVIHFTGIKGVGMTPLALCALDLGKKVSGSDTDEVFPTDKVLRKRKIRWQTGFSENHLPKKCQLVIYTGAHGGITNPEVKAAKQKHIPVLNYGQALGVFSQGKKVLATAGVGGKSTTSAILATILDSAGLEPSFAVGVGNISPLDTPARYSKTSPYFVIETDEYVADPQADPTPKFHYLKPFMAIITNIEHDHPDVYPSLDKIYQVFSDFVKSIPKDGRLIVNLDSSHLKRFIRSLKQPVITYGFSPRADWQITKTHTADKKQFFSLKHRNIAWPDFILSVPGQYNVLNATASIIAAHHLGVSAEKIQAGLKKFTGAKRRFEFIDKVKGIELYDDYAHHPIEIKALLKAARDWLPGKRIIAIFQSHTYSRTKVLLNDFAKSFNLASQVLINQIFASAREKDNLGISGKILTQAIKKHYSQTFYCPGKKETINHLLEHSQKGDAVFTIGAGNNWLWHQDILKALKQR